MTNEYVAICYELDIFFIRHVLRLQPIARLLVPREYASRNDTCFSSALISFEMQIT